MPKRPIIVFIALIFVLATGMAHAVPYVRTTYGNGLFRNPDYSDPSVFLAQGAMTQATAPVLEYGAGIGSAPPRNTRDKIRLIWLRIKGNTAMTGGTDLTRTADAIARDGQITNPRDYATLFASLSRTIGIPTLVVQAVHIDWINKWVNREPGYGTIIGHAFCEVYLDDGKWYLVDPMKGRLYTDYDRNNPALPDGFHTLGKGTDYSDVYGFTTDKCLADDNCQKLTRESYRKFDTGTYSAPVYDCIDLTTNQPLVAK